MFQNEDQSRNTISELLNIKKSLRAIRPQLNNKVGERIKLSCCIAVFDQLKKISSPRLQNDSFREHGVYIHQLTFNVRIWNTKIDECRIGRGWN